MKLTLLSEDQVQGPRSLEVIRAQDGSPISDLAVGTGNYWSSSGENHIGCGPTLLKAVAYDQYNMFFRTNVSSVFEEDCTSTIRPIIEGDDAKIIYEKANKKGLQQINGHWLEVVEFGEYPQDVEWNYGLLEDLYSKRKLPMTGRFYTLNLDQRDSDNSCRPCTLGPSPVYEFQGKRYVRDLVHSFCDATTIGGKCAVTDYPCWYEVQPIKWIKDPSGILVAEKGLVSGIPAKEAQEYMDTYMAKEILPPIRPERDKLKERNSVFVSQFLNSGKSR